MSIFPKAVITAFILFFAITIFSQVYQYVELGIRKSSLEKQIYEANEGIAEIQEQLNEEMDDAYIERIARSMLNYHLPEEILFFNDLIN